MKRTISVILSIVMVLSVFAVCAISAEAVTFECGVGKTKQLEDRNYWGDGSTTTKTWWSSDESIAKVQSQSGATCQIYGVSEGSVTIYCQTIAKKWVGDSRYGYEDVKTSKKEYDVRVVSTSSNSSGSGSSQKKVVIGQKKTSVNNKNKIVKNKKKKGISVKSANLVKGKSLKLKLKKSKASKVKWKSSNKKVATVSKKGKVKTKKIGKATITAKYKGKKYKCKINVISKTTTKKENIYRIVRYTVKEAFEKVKAYIKNNGERNDQSYIGVDTTLCKWTVGEYTYSLGYDNNDENIFFSCYTKKPDMLTIDVYPDKETTDCTVYFGLTTGLELLNTYKKDYVKGKTLNFKVKYKDEKSTDSAEIAKASQLVWSAFPVFDNYINSKIGVDMYELGFVNYK